MHGVSSSSAARYQCHGEAAEETEKYIVAYREPVTRPMIYKQTAGWIDELLSTVAELRNMQQQFL
jgi:hypothetical protein